MNRLLLTVMGLLLTANTLAADGDWSVDLLVWEDGSLADTSPQEREDISRQALHLGYRWAHSDPSGHALRYEHQTLRIRQGNPASNGYLHQIDWRHGADWQQLRGELTLGVHGSSNMFKHADFHRDALVATGAISHRVGTTGARLGLAGDYRFGPFTLYPQWQTSVPLGPSTLHLNLPVAILLQGPEGNWQLGFERYGEKWATLDSERQVSNKLYLQEWRLSGRYRLLLRPGDLALVVGAGVSLHGRVHYLDLDSGARRERMQDRVYVSLGLRW